MEETQITHEITSDLPEFIIFDDWVRERTTADEYQLFLERSTSENPSIKVKNIELYNAWVKDQEITHIQKNGDETISIVTHADL